MIVVTAPSGNIGNQVLTKLVERGEKVRVIARHPEKLSRSTRARVEVIQGSHGDVDVVNRAFTGATAVFWLVAGDPRAPSAEAAFVDFSRPAAAALRANGVEHVVSISALGRGWSGDAGHATASIKMDDLLASTGVAYRALACPSLMENVLRQVPALKTHGNFYWTVPADHAEPTVATRDVAAVAAELLRNRNWSGVEDLPLLGPENLTFTEMTSLMSEVLGKAIHYHVMTAAQLKQGMLERGASEGMAQAMVNMMVAKNNGLDHLLEHVDRTNTPTTFRAWCESVLRSAVQR